MYDERIETLKNLRHLCYRYLTQKGTNDTTLDDYKLKPNTFVDAVNSFIKIDNVIGLLQTETTAEKYLKIMKSIMEDDKDEKDVMPF